MNKPEHSQLFGTGALFPKEAIRTSTSYDFLGNYCVRNEYLEEFIEAASAALQKGTDFRIKLLGRRKTPRSVEKCGEGHEFIQFTGLEYH